MSVGPEFLETARHPNAPSIRTVTAAFAWLVMLMIPSARQGVAMANAVIVPVIESAAPALMPVTIPEPARECEKFTRFVKTGAALVGRRRTCRYSLRESGDRE